MEKDEQSNKIKINGRTELIGALKEATELEHILMLQYLYAASTLKQDPEEFLNEKRKWVQFELVRNWHRKILRVAREEMQHLAYVTNLLIAVGGSIDFTKNNFPSFSRYFDSTNHQEKSGMILAPFDYLCIRRFIQFESSPKNSNWDPVQMKELEDYEFPSNPFENISKDFHFIPGINYTSIHMLYNGIIECLRDMEKNGIELFIAKDDQIDFYDNATEVRRTRQHQPAAKISNLNDAIKILDKIISEGEGSSCGDPNAHREIFITIKKEYEKEYKEDQNFVPCRKVICNPIQAKSDDAEYGTSGQTKPTLISENEYPLAYQLLNCFNGCYVYMLHWLTHYFNNATFNYNPNGINAIKELVFFPFMTEIIKPFMDLITSFKLDKNIYLGPSFDFGRYNYLSNSHNVLVKLQHERNKDIVKSLRSIAKNPDKRIRKLQSTLLYLARNLELFDIEFNFRTKYPDYNEQDPKTYFALKSISKYSENPSRYEVSQVSDYSIKLHFRGWFEVRLATDPDSAIHKRGVSGNCFSFGNEPKLDRIIKLQGEKLRSHGQEIGVKVYESECSLGYGSESVEIENFQDANINLLDNPVFNGVNHLISFDGEPVDPFHIQIKCIDGKTILSRKIKGNNEINEENFNQPPMYFWNVIDRKLSYRYPISLYIDTKETFKLRKLINNNDPNTNGNILWRRRIDNLKNDLKNLKKEDKNYYAKKVIIESRLIDIKNCYDYDNDMTKPNIRNTRLGFVVKYNHLISGEISSTDIIKIGNDSYTLSESPWKIQYSFQHMDTDVLCAIMEGTLEIPLKKKKN